MTCTGEAHDGTGMAQGTDVEMHCPHVITDQVVIACKEKINQRKAAMSLPVSFRLFAHSQGTGSEGRPLLL